MAKIRPFQAIRPSKEFGNVIPALPYDVFSEAEARAYVAAHPGTFLTIDRPETMFEAGQDPYAPEVYKKAAETFDAWIREGRFLEEACPCYYVYELTMDGRTQTGLVAVSSVGDYENDVILKHENTRAEKELDRIRHVDALSAQTGPIFLAFRPVDRIREILKEAKHQTPLYDLTGEDGVTHRVYRIDSPDRIEELTRLFASIDHTYIADGHHRAASAVKVSRMRRESNRKPTGEEAYESFLSVLFPADELKIFDYNRVVSDLNGLTKESFLTEVGRFFKITPEAQAVRPSRPHEFGMFLSGCWYRLTAKDALLSDDAVDGLDVSILQNALLGPILGIGDPKTDRRIAFVGGIRGLEELKKRAGSGVGFSMFPTSMDELFRVADAHRLMPPKSTWFEPKLRSGFLIHRIER